MNHAGTGWGQVSKRTAHQHFTNKDEFVAGYLPASAPLCSYIAAAETAREPAPPVLDN